MPLGLPLTLLVPAQGWHDGKGRKRTGGGTREKEALEGSQQPQRHLCSRHTSKNNRLRRRRSFSSPLSAVHAQNPAWGHQGPLLARPRKHAQQLRTPRSALLLRSRTGTELFKPEPDLTEDPSGSLTPPQSPPGLQGQLPQGAPVRPHRPPLSSTPIAQALPLWWHPALLCSALSISPCDRT